MAKPQTTAPSESTTKPVLLLTIGRLVGYVVTFLMPVTLVRIFSPAEFGTYKQVFLIYTTLVGIGQIGMAESLYYFVPRAPEHAGRYISNTLLMLVVTGLMLLGMSWLGAEHLARWWSNPDLVAYLPILGVSIFLGLASISFETMLVSQSQYGAASILYGTTDTVRAGIFIAAALITRDLRWLLIGAVVYGALRCVAMVVYLVRRFGPELRPDVRLWKQQLAYALPFTVAAWATFNPEGLLVAGWVDTATFAVYSVGCLNVPLVEVLASAFGNVLMVKLGNHIREGRPVVALWHQVNERLALVCLPLLVALLLTAQELFGLLFPAYSASVPIFRIFSLTILLAIVPIDAVLRSYAENRTILLLNLARLALIFVSIHFLFARFGLTGAVLASLVAGLIMKAAAVVRIGKLMNLGVRDFMPWRALGKIAAAALVAIVPAALVRAQLLSWHPLPLGAITTIVYGLVYVVMAAALGLLPDLVQWPRWRFAAHSESE